MCTNGSSPLLGKFHLGDLVLNNKICMAPVTRARGNDGVPSELMMEYYKQRSAAGLIISEGCFVCESSRDPQTTGLVTEEMKYAWKQLVEITKKNNNKSIIFAQLWHAGRASHTSFRKDKSPSIAPSAKPITGKLIRTPTGLVPPEIPKELTITEIKEVIQAYKDAAEKALQAGFDGIEIHAANGYLIDTFLQGTTNQRTDIYGGSFENNFRFLRELIEELSSVFPIHRIGVRLSPNGNYNDMGTPDYNECFAYYLGELNKYNIAYVHILDGIAFGFHNYGPPFSLEKTRQYFHGTIMCNCGHSVEDAADIIAQNRADLVSFGRLFISNPDLVNRIRHNWPVNTQGLVRDDSWYSGGPVGYTDYPLFSETN